MDTKQGGQMKSEMTRPLLTSFDSGRHTDEEDKTNCSKQTNRVDYTKENGMGELQEQDGKQSCFQLYCRVGRR